MVKIKEGETIYIKTIIWLKKTRRLNIQFINLLKGKINDKIFVIKII